MREKRVGVENRCRCRERESREEKVGGVAELSTGQKLSTGITKKTEMKRENSPCTPYKRKAKGKENKPGIFMAGLSRATRARTTGVRACVTEAVVDALVAFHGTRGPAPSDEALWANFAWTFGYQKLLDAVYQGEAEMHEHETEIPESEQPKVLQTILNKYWETRKGGSK